MNDAVIRELVKESFDATAAFPEVVATLLRERFESYHVDYIRGEGRYYHQGGETLVIPYDHDFPAVSCEFNPAEVQAAIKRSQAGTATYRDFLRDSAAAGCAYYIVYLKGQKVRYFGRDGEEHTEHFPGAR